MTTLVRSRFIFSLVANTFRAAISFATGLLLARYLGPAEYGKMVFLLGTFLALRSLLDMGGGAALFTFLSQHPRPKKFVQWYFGWMAAQFALPIIGIALIFPMEWVSEIWRGEPRGLVLLAFAAVFMQNGLWPVASQMCEAQRKTAWVQSVSVGVAIVHLVVILALLWGELLGLYTLFVALILEYFVVTVFVLRQFDHPVVGEFDPDDEKPRLVIGKFARYCVPLLPYTCVGFVAEFADTWLLQTYGGSVEQAYFAVGMQFSMISLLVANSILQILWKEIAEVNHQGNQQRMELLYKKITRFLFFVSVAIAGFLIPWSEMLLRLLLGQAYAGGATVLAIMLIYPALQTIGQIVGTMLYATEKYSIQIMVGMVSMIVGLALTWFVLAPVNAPVPGLGMGSEGMAMKIVGVQLVGVNVTMFLIARHWDWRFDWIFQPIILIACLGAGWLAALLAQSIDALARLPLLQMFAGAVLYCTIIMVLLISWPTIAGSSRSECTRVLTKARLFATNILS